MSRAQQAEWLTLKTQCPAVAGLLQMVFAEQAPEVAQALVFLIRRTGSQLVHLTEPGDIPLRRIVSDEVVKMPRSREMLTMEQLMRRYRAVCRELGCKPVPAHVAGRWLRQMMEERHGVRPTRTATTRGYAGVALKNTKGKKL